MKTTILVLSFIAAAGASSAVAMIYFDYPSRPVYKGVCFMQPMLALPNGAIVATVVCEREKEGKDESRPQPSKQGRSMDDNRRELATPVRSN